MLLREYHISKQQNLTMNISETNTGEDYINVDFTFGI